MNYPLIRGDNMELEFKVVSAKKCTKKDVITALDIYCKSVDPGSLTDTNQIKDYIWNSEKHVNEKRTMFFYLLYGKNDEVMGYAEFAYLPNNQVLVLDYLCTCQRNHLLFFNFYHMVIQEITDSLKKKGCFIRYIITELSLNNQDGKLIDVDSNYFRHLLSLENYKLLKYPYYQPPLLNYDRTQEFNIAIKLLLNEEIVFTLTKLHYLSIIEELYFSHYKDWYQNYSQNKTIDKLLKELLERIKKEITVDETIEAIALVQCQLFEEGQCPKFFAENITIPRIRKKKWKTRITIILWSVLSFVTFLLCIIPSFSDIVTTLCSSLTIIAGIISIISLRKEL